MIIILLIILGIGISLVLVYSLSPRRKFYKEYKLWRRETSFLSHSILENEHYRNIVKMGKKATPYILEVIKKQPDHVVNALQEIFPGVIEISGSVALVDYCNVWIEVLETSKP